ncbi:serine hydrolase domain-containing protein [Rossellomorea sp. AcN35-11]|nr:beta-lactamase family protein [Rossellomorea aquimaris]WJV29636.1 serine hydrolase domain-containing protein [Rossellomorea sp. AcN35-11]
MQNYTETMNQLTDSINEMLHQHKGAGCSVAIVKDAEIIYSKGFGHSRLQPEERPMDGDTLMSIQSVSKNFMAVSIMQLVEENLVALDDPIVTHLPYFRTKNKEQSDRITVRHVLSHTAGFPSEIGIANMIAPNVKEIFSDTPTEFQEALDHYQLTEEEITRIETRDDITKWFKKVELDYTPGEGWDYCTDAYVILADLFEKVTGETWESHLREKVLAPLDMTRTTADPQKVQKDHNSARYYLGEDQTETPFPINPISAPIGYLYSTANDLAKYVRFHLNEGAGILRQELKEDMQKPVQLVSEDWQFGSEVRSYGLAWFTDTYKGYKVVEHGGGQMAVRSLIKMVPELGLGVVVLLNFDGSMHHDVGDMVVDCFSGL